VLFELRHIIAAIAQTSAPLAMARNGMLAAKSQNARAAKWFCPSQILLTNYKGHQNMARRKSAAVNAPANIQEATDMLGQYALGITTAESIRAHYDATIAKLQAERDAAIAPLETHMKDMFISLRSWWAVTCLDITDGKRKTAEIAGCLIGLRTNNPALKLPPKMTEGDAIEWLSEHMACDFVNFTAKLNKAALIAAIRSDANATKAKLLAAGFDIRQPEQFFIDRVKLEPSAAATQQLPDDTLDQGETK
jgi:phage host-nuclease inhibitor protein Gam